MGIKRIGGGMAVNQITEGVIWKQLLYFFFPILFGTFFQQLYNTADAVIVGQFVGTQALAAVGGATGSLINFFVNLFVGLASGTTVVIAQAYGAHDARASAVRCIPRWRWLWPRGLVLQQSAWRPRPGR